MQPLVSVIIPVFNSAETVRDCINSVLDSDFGRPFEIIVVDDGSSDGTADELADMPVALLKQDHLGAAAARNRGAAAAAGEILVFADSDLIFFTTTLKEIYGRMVSEHADYLSILYSRSPANSGWIQRYKAIADYYYYFHFIFPSGARDGIIRGDTLGGGVEAYRKDVFAEAGGFDENIKGAGIERETLFNRIRKERTIVSDPGIKTKHFFPGFGRLCRDYWSRTYATMALVDRSSYHEPYIFSNLLRVGSGALIPLLAGAAVIFPGDLWPRLAAADILIYLFLHADMFAYALRRYGPVYLIYTAAVNLFFCFLIVSAALAGIAASRFKALGRAAGTGTV